MPESFKKVQIPNKDFGGNDTLEYYWDSLIEQVQEFYELAIKYGIPKEDARFALPMGTVSREVVSFSFEALQHFCDIRECLRAQWEIRKVAILMHKEINKYYPILGKKLGCRCLSNRNGQCNEQYNEYQKCRRSKIRPHRNDLIKLWEKNGRTTV